MYKYILIISTILYSQQAVANKICESVESLGEGHWPINEERFNKESAKESLVFLSEYIKKTNKSERPPAPEDMMDIRNELTMIKGYIFKLILNTNHSEDKIYKRQKEYLKEEFCEFIKKEAVVRH